MSTDKHYCPCGGSDCGNHYVENGKPYCHAHEIEVGLFETCPWPSKKVKPIKSYEEFGTISKQAWDSITSIPDAAKGERCKTCRFRIDELCHRNPPMPRESCGATVYSLWSMVPSDGWCGEYEKKA